MNDIKKSIILSSPNMATDDMLQIKQLGKNGAEMIRKDEVILTHCNAGSLATVSYGTALGVLRAQATWVEVSVIATENKDLLCRSR